MKKIIFSLAVAVSGLFLLSIQAHAAAALFTIPGHPNVNGTAPAAVWLFGAGLLRLIGVRRKFRN